MGAVLFRSRCVIGLRLVAVGLQSVCSWLQSAAIDWQLVCSNFAVGSELVNTPSHPLGPFNPFSSLTLFSPLSPLSSVKPRNTLSTP